jgi:folate-dependent phosphoribosylglycinamide formyltransferase PurN
MISASARAATIAAFERRLAQLGAVEGLLPVPRGAGEPEEALRQLMVRYLPATAALTPNQRAHVCDLFVEIAESARGKDVRFLDAFNVWFEAVNGRDEWMADPGWQAVRRHHAVALVAAIARLRESARRVEAAPAGDPGATPSLVKRAAAGDRMKVLVLADNWAAARRVLEPAAQVDGADVQALICNNSSTSPIRFAASQAAAIATTGFAGVTALLRALAAGRVRFALAKLHDDGVVRWIRRSRFAIGLHAMGVIYRERLLQAFTRGVLNSHIGILPEYRGRSVMEWSLLAGRPTGITVFFMDGGIDTGPDVVIRRFITVSGATTQAAKASLFRRDGEMYAEALRRIAAGAPLAENGGGRRYYVMSALLTSVVDSLLTAGQSAAEPTADAA